jgi:patatin-like phospholipase/acyl hydrolase
MAAAPQSPLRLLSIGKPVLSMLLQANENAKSTTSDGGGIRGLSSLYIIQSIMKALQSKAKGEGVARQLLPCEYFDLIGGTSTGG